jgi:hypothetical protein
MVLIMKTRTISAVAFLLCATGAAAQDVSPSCSNSGPGARFGVTSYTCVSCRITQGGGKTTFGFESEPVIQQVTSANGLQPGDVVIAINGKPITTEAGAAAFTNPPTGTSVIKVRRGRNEVEVSVDPKGPCWRTISSLDLAFRNSIRVNPEMKLRLDSGRIRLDSLFSLHVKTGRLEFRNNIQVSPRLKLVRDSLTKKLSFAFERIKGDLPELGMALQCEPSCTLVRGKDGKYYYQFDGYPRVRQIRSPTSVPDRFQIGDRIISIDGVETTTEEGFRKVRTLKDNASHSVVVDRNGERITLSVRYR